MSQSKLHCESKEQDSVQYENFSKTLKISPYYENASSLNGKSKVAASRSRKICCYTVLMGISLCLVLLTVAFVCGWFAKEHFLPCATHGYNSTSSIEETAPEDTEEESTIVDDTSANATDDTQRDGLMLVEHAHGRFVLALTTIEVKNFSSSHWTPNQVVKFTVPSFDNAVVFRIDCYPNETNNHVGIWFRLVSAPTPVLPATATVSIVQANQSLTHSYELVNHYFTAGSISWGLSPYIDRGHLLRNPHWLHNGNLLLRVQVTTVYTTQQYSNPAALLDTPSSNISRVTMKYNWQVCNMALLAIVTGGSLASNQFPTNQTQVSKFHFAIHHFDAKAGKMTVKLCLYKFIAVKSLRVTYSMSIVNPSSNRVIQTQSGNATYHRQDSCSTIFDDIPFNRAISADENCLQMQFLGHYNV